jgi:replication-associated recombination protein RarA
VAETQELKKKQVAAKKEFPWPTNGGYDFYEVESALQKSVRRGDEELALYFAHELHASGYAPHLWGRLKTIATEDVGVADSRTAVLVRALYENWLDGKAQRKENPNEGLLYVTHAVMALARAPKSRIVDHATIVTKLRLTNEGPPIPDYALDKHTRKGQSMGRWWKFFRKTGAKLVQPHDDVAPMVDPYEARCFELLEKHEPIPKHCNGGVETE